MNPTELEELLGGRLEATATAYAVTPPDDGLADIRRRAKARARRRRSRRAIAIAVVVTLAIGVGALVFRGGTDSATVVNGPEQPVDQLPHLGLVGTGDAWTISEFQPGRRVAIELVPSGRPSTEPVTLELVAGPPGASSVDAPVADIEPATVGDLPAVSAVSITTLDRLTDQSTTRSTFRLPVLRWSPAPGVQAALGTSIDTLFPAMIDPSAATDSIASIAILRGIAERLAPIDDESWWQALNPTQPNAVERPLSTTAADGDAAIDRYALPTPHSAGSVRQVLDLSSYPAGSVTIETVAMGPTVPTSGAPIVATVQGVDAYLDLPIFGPPDSSHHALTWIDGDAATTLTYPASAAQAEMVDLANRLRPLDDQRWRNLLEPTAVRLDLVTSARSNFPWFDLTTPVESTTTTL